MDACTRCWVKTCFLRLCKTRENKRKYFFLFLCTIFMHLLSFFRHDALSLICCTATCLRNQRRKQLRNGSKVRKTVRKIILLLHCWPFGLCCGFIALNGELVCAAVMKLWHDKTGAYFGCEKAVWRKN